MESSKQEHRAVGQIQQLLGSGPNMEASPLNVGDLSRILNKMPQRNNKDVINQVISKLFDVAGEKMKDDHDKAVLKNLKQFVILAQEDLLTPKPRYLDAFFFPNEKNIDKLVLYLTKATKSLKVCVFNLTNDKLANALDAAHKRGVQVRIISDDECMTNQGSDVHWLSE